MSGFLINSFAFGSVDITAPTITSSATVSVNENATLSHALTANESVTWSIVGGADAGDFELSGSTLRWLGNGTKDWEGSEDFNSDNQFIVTVRATDLATNTTDQSITVTLLDVFEDVTAPTITSSASVSVNESATLSHSLTANETVTWSIFGGDDASDFEISGSTLRWAGDGTKDWEGSEDFNSDNQFLVTVRATDLSSNTTNQSITVTLLDVSDGPTPHRYWRIFAETNNGDGSFISLTEMEMCEADFGVNVVSGGTVSASSQFSGAFAPSFAVNDVYNSTAGTGRWASSSTGGTNEWIKYDFGSGNDKTIVSVGIVGAGDGEFDQSVKDIRIEYSDDDASYSISWIDSLTFASDNKFLRSTKTGSEASYTGSPYGTHTYWRIFIQKSAGAAVSAAEVEMRATPSGADQCAGGTASVSTLLIGTAADIFDNNNSTFWAINGGAGAWIKYQFASPVSLAEVAFRIRGDGNPSHAPQDLLVQFSDNNSVWTTAWQVLAQTSWSDGQQRIFTSPDYI